MNRSFIALPAALALTACGGGKTVSLENASVDEVAAATKAAGVDAPGFKPGQWETTSQVVDFNVPGMADGPLKDRMQKMMTGSTQTSSRCITPEEARDPKAGMFAGENKGNCTFRKYNMGNGRIDATMECPSSMPPGSAMVMNMDGTYSADTYAVNADATVSGGPQPMKMAIKMSGRRTGDCTKSGG